MSVAKATAEARALLGAIPGGDLPEEVMADLIEAYARYEPSLRRVRRRPALSCEPAHVFDPRNFAPRGSS